MKPLVSDIVIHVANTFGITPDDIIGPGRLRKFARPRQAVFWLARTMTDKSYPQIGEVIGGRDHSTVIHGYNQAINMMRRDSIYRTRVLWARLLVTYQAKPFLPKRINNRINADKPAYADLMQSPVVIEAEQSAPWWTWNDDDLLSDAVAAHYAREAA